MAFVVLSLFNTLRFPLVVLPKALRGASGLQSTAWLVETHLAGDNAGMPRVTTPHTQAVLHKKMLRENASAVAACCTLWGSKLKHCCMLP